MKKAMKRYGRPRTIVTDRLRSYRAAMKVTGNADRQETERWLNNWAENSHQPFRRRERAMLGFRNAATLQKFASVHSSFHDQFYLERHLTNRQTCKFNRPSHLKSGASLQRDACCQRTCSACIMLL